MYVYSDCQLSGLVTPRAYALAGLSDNTFQSGHLELYELRKRHKNSRNGSILSSVYLAEVKVVAFAVLSSGYRSQALLLHALRPTLY